MKLEENNQNIVDKSTENIIESVKDLLTAMEELKKSGILEMLTYFAKNANEAFLSVANDPTLIRGLAILAALLRGLEKADADMLSGAQNNLSEITKCAINSLGNIDMKKKRKLGLLGLLQSLNDPDISYGLALLLELAKGIGACASKNNQRNV